MKIRSALHAQPSEYEVLDKESLTVPDQSLTVRDIISRFTRGQITIPPVETGDSDTFDDAHDFGDMVDVADAIRVGNDNLTRIQNERKVKEDTPPDSSGTSASVDSPRE